MALHARCSARWGTTVAAMIGAGALILCALVTGVATGAALAAQDVDLSGVTLSSSDLPDGFSTVPDDVLAQFDSSARQIGENLEDSFEEARLEQFVVYASEDDRELIEVMVAGPLVPVELAGMRYGLADPEQFAEEIMPSFVMWLDLSEPTPLDTGGIGEASAGFSYEGTVSSDAVQVANPLGYEFTEQTTRFLLAIRGNYVFIVATSFAGSGDAEIDLVATAHQVDVRLAAALGVAGPGRFRPTGTFSPEVATNIPTLTEVSTDPAVVGANLVLAALAVMAMTLGMRLLNTTLVAHEGALEQLLRPARALGRWWGRADAALEQRTGRFVGIVRTLGVLLFYGVLFSFLEPGWRPWTASGLFVLIAMTIAFGLVGTADDMVELRSAHRWGLPARLSVKPALVLIAVGSVALTKVAGLVPGLMIGTPEAFSLEDEAAGRDEARLAGVGLGVTALVGLTAWALAAPVGSAFDGSGGLGQAFLGGLAAVLVLVFAVAVENLFANLLAFPGSEGATLREHSKVAWWICMATVTALFFHTLVNPGGEFAEALESTNVRVVFATVAVFLVVTALIRLAFVRRDRAAPAAAVSMSSAAMVSHVEPPAAPQSAAPAVAATAVPAVAATAVLAGEPLPAPVLAPTPEHLRAPEPLRAPEHLRAPEPLRVLEPALAVVVGRELERPHRDHHPFRVFRRIVLLSAVLGLVAAVAVVVRQRQRDQGLFDEAHAAYVAGDCVAAIDRYDELLSNSRLVDHVDVTDPARVERADCVELLAIDALAASDPIGALLGYADFVGRDLAAPLVPAVTERAATLIDREGAAAVASIDSCDRLDALETDGIVPVGSIDEMTLECAVVFDTGGRADEAYALAVDVLEATTDDALAQRAADLALASPAACDDVDRLVALGGLADAPDRLVGFLQGCMATATAGNDTAMLATLQLDFLSLLPDHADAAGVEASMLANIDACNLMSEVRADPVVSVRSGFLATYTFGCAQIAEYSGDYTAAVERYQWFLDNVPLEPRSGVALDGLARSTVALAKQRGASELPTPAPSGGSGSSAAEITIYNDTPDDLRIVVSGPESRIVVIPASPTSSSYSTIGPTSCRTDVPSVELEMTAGTYDVLVETTTADDIADFLGSWALDAYDAYESCFFIVTTFGV